MTTKTLIKKAAAELQETDFLNMNKQQLERTVRKIVRELTHSKKAA